MRQKFAAHVPSSEARCSFPNAPCRALDLQSDRYAFLFFVEKGWWLVRVAGGCDAWMKDLQKGWVQLIMKKKNVAVDLSKENLALFVAQRAGMNSWWHLRIFRTIWVWRFIVLGFNWMNLTEILARPPWHQDITEQSWKLPCTESNIMVVWPWVGFTNHKQGIKITTYLSKCPL